MALSVLSFSSKTDSQSGNLSVFISVLVPLEKEMPPTAGLVHGAHKDSRKYGEGEGRFAWNSRMSSTPLLRSGFWKGLILSLENCSLGKRRWDPGKREGCLSHQNSFKAFRVGRLHTVVFRRAWNPEDRPSTSGFPAYWVMSPGGSFLSPEPLSPQLENAVNQYLQTPWYC